MVFMATKLLNPEICYDCCTSGYHGDCWKVKQMAATTETIDVPPASDTVTADTADDSTASGPVKVYFSWDDIHCMATKNATKIEDVECIIALSRGGLPVARMIAEHLNVKIVTIALKLYGDNDEIEEEPEIYQWLDTNAIQMFKNKKCMVVDEVNDTGTTLACVAKRLRADGFTKLCCMVIHHKIKERQTDAVSMFDEYHAMQTTPDYWIVYPWEAKDIDEHNRLAANKPSSFVKSQNHS